jgi:hypothetical protein
MVDDSQYRKTGKPEQIDIAKETVDWSENCLPLGVEIPGVATPWMALNEAELRLLVDLLNTKTLEQRAYGGEWVLPAVERSENLMKLSAWAKAAADWLKERTVKGGN